jgi:tetratricopeptide (TPR) repeat protein
MRQDLEERFIDGQFKFMDEDFEGCIAVFSEILEEDPRCAKVYQARAIACLRLNDNDTAIKNIDAAIKCEPENARLYYHKGGILFKAEVLDEALVASIVPLESQVGLKGSGLYWAVCAGHLVMLVEYVLQRQLYIKVLK